MFGSLYDAHGDGQQAGRMGLNFEPQPNGIKVARTAFEECPFKKRWEVLQRTCWLEGWQRGLSDRLANYPMRGAAAE